MNLNAARSISNARIVNYDSRVVLTRKWHVFTFINCLYYCLQRLFAHFAKGQTAL